MTNRITPREIMPGLYRLETPLEGYTLESVNSYVITGGPRSLVIDPGPAGPAVAAAAQAAWRALGLDPARTDFLVTHAHLDHLGLLRDLPAAGARLYIHARDAARFRGPFFWRGVMDYALKIGFPAETLAAIRARFKYAFAPGLLEGWTVRLVRDGEVLSVGDYRLRCLHTPGHSEGHICLYEPGRKLFFSGDHLMDSLPPMILLTRFGCDALGLYLAGLERLGRLESALILPGHGPAFTDLGREIRGVLAVHEQRLAWFADLARSGAITPLEAAPRMSWRRRLAHWGQADDILKWLGLTEALAYLWHLKQRGRLEFNGTSFRAV